MNQPPIFVYGTLKPGGKMFRHISHVVKEAIPAAIPGCLYDTPFGYPLLLCPGGEEDLLINGVILIPLEDMYDELMRIIDVIEGEAGFEKEIREVMLEDGTRIDAVVYLYREAPPYAHRFFGTEWP